MKVKDKGTFKRKKERKNFQKKKNENKRIKIRRL